MGSKKYAIEEGENWLKEAHGCLIYGIWNKQGLSNTFYQKEVKWKLLGPWEFSLWTIFWSLLVAHYVMSKSLTSQKGAPIESAKKRLVSCPVPSCSFEQNISSLTRLEKKHLPGPKLLTKRLGGPRSTVVLQRMPWAMAALSHMTRDRKWVKLGHWRLAISLTKRVYYGFCGGDTIDDHWIQSYLNFCIFDLFWVSMRIYLCITFGGVHASVYGINHQPRDFWNMKCKWFAKHTVSIISSLSHSK